MDCARTQASNPSPPPENYGLVPNDLLEIRVFQEEDLTLVARVPRDGAINFPLIGRVVVGGKSVSAAADTIRTLLAKRFLVNPQVSVTIQEYAKRRFTVIGQVQKPGAYDLPNEQEIDLLEAIGMAGGYTRIANPGSITLKRVVNDHESVFKLNGKKMAEGSDAGKFRILPGDTITVAESIF